MKRLYIVLILSMIVILSSCYKKKYESLESKNKQLQQQIDSLKQFADTARNEAIKAAMEAKLYREEALKAKLPKEKPVEKFVIVK